MRHHFHILFAVALLFGSLILFQNQKSDPEGQVREIPDMENVELAAELPVQRTNIPLVKAGRHHCILSHLNITEKRRDPAMLNPASGEMRVKAQMILFLEIRPVLDFRSGLYLFHSSSYGDPPGYRS